jgi:hypothetical protein
VILVDANLLVYARVSGMPQHAAARTWLDERLNGTTRVGLPWSSLTAFLRIVTNPRIFARPEPLTAAWAQVEAWLGQDAAWIPVPTDRHQTVLGTILARTRGGPDLVPDAHLAALAIEHGLTLCSTDGDFARFPGLRWDDPLRG